MCQKNQLLKPSLINCLSDIHLICVIFVKYHDKVNIKDNLQTNHCRKAVTSLVYDNRLIID